MNAYLSPRPLSKKKKKRREIYRPVVAFYYLRRCARAYIYVRERACERTPTECVPLRYVCARASRLLHTRRERKSCNSEWSFQDFARFKKVTNRRNAAYSGKRII